MPSISVRARNLHAARIQAAHSHPRATVGHWLPAATSAPSQSKAASGLVYYLVHKYLQLLLMVLKADEFSVNTKHDRIVHSSSAHINTEKPVLSSLSFHRGRLMSMVIYLQTHVSAASSVCCMWQ